MNARQRKFAHEYVRLKFNGVRAVYAAGYNQGYNAARVTAARLLTKASVMSEIERHLNKSKMEADEVLERLTTIARTNADFKGSDVVKAAELLGKGHKLFVDRVESADTTPDNSLTFLSRRIAKLAQKSSKSLQSVELELQTELADRSDEDYSVELDARVHPECWPSGNLLDAESPVIQVGDQ